jgi:Rod binding domain-containing protein
VSDLVMSSVNVGTRPSTLGALPLPTSTQRPREAMPEHDSPEVHKLRKSTQEFEAMLVSSWWQEMQNSFRDPDEEQEAGSDTLQQIGFQSMATAMAASGGIGLARMVFHCLAPALEHSKPLDGATDLITKEE